MCFSMQVCLCVCVCVMPHIVLQMALGSPWRLVTYNPDVVGVFWLPGMLRKGGGGLRGGGGLLVFHFQNYSG